MGRVSQVVIIAGTILTIGMKAPIQAANDRSWVSNSGSDDSPCTLTAPCSTFQKAHDETNAGGEVDVLNPGDYGPLVITKEITIDGGSTFASIRVGKIVSGVSINTPSGVVTLRNLSISKRFSDTASGIFGINVSAATRVYIDNLSITGFTDDSIHFVQTAPTGTPVISIRNTTITYCFNVGILISGSVRAVVEGVVVDSAIYGLEARDGAQVSIRGSTLSNNAAWGLRASGGGSDVDMQDSLIEYTTGIGIISTSNAVVNVSKSTIRNNKTGLSTDDSGRIVSFGDNRIIGNSTDGEPSDTKTLN